MNYSGWVGSFGLMVTHSSLLYPLSRVQLIIGWLTVCGLGKPSQYITSRAGLYQFPLSNLVGVGLGLGPVPEPDLEWTFFRITAIHLMKLTASSVLSAATERQWSSVLLMLSLFAGNNNNNNLIYIAPACRMTSEALADSSSRATECLTEK